MNGVLVFKIINETQGKKTNNKKNKTTMANRHMVPLADIMNGIQITVSALKCTH